MTARKIVERALEGRTFLTRQELAERFAGVGVKADRIRLALLMMRLELDQVVCSGPRRGNQFTYALFDDRARPSKPLDRDEAMARLARRYFTSHGPASARDLTWWSGLSAMDVKTAIEAAGEDLLKEDVDGTSYWCTRSAAVAVRHRSPMLHLLPNYDEYHVAYRDRQPIIRTLKNGRLASTRADGFAHTLVIDGHIAGIWTVARDSKKPAVRIIPYRRFTRAESSALERAIEEYLRFSHRISPDRARLSV